MLIQPSLRRNLHFSFRVDLKNCLCVGFAEIKSSFCLLQVCVLDSNTNAGHCYCKVNASEFLSYFPIKPVVGIIPLRS